MDKLKQHPKRSYSKVRGSSEDRWRKMSGCLPVLEGVELARVQAAIEKQSRVATVNIQNHDDGFFDHQLNIQATRDSIVPTHVSTASAFFDQDIWGCENAAWLFLPLLRSPDGVLTVQGVFDGYDGFVDVLVVPCKLVNEENMMKMEAELRGRFIRSAQIINKELMKHDVVCAGHMGIRIDIHNTKMRITTSPMGGTKMIHLAQKILPWDVCEQLWKEADEMKRQASSMLFYKDKPMEFFQTYVFEDALNMTKNPSGMTVMQEYVMNLGTPTRMMMKGMHARQLIMENTRFQVLTEGDDIEWVPKRYEEMSTPMDQMEEDLSCNAITVRKRVVEPIVYNNKHKKANTVEETLPTPITSMSRRSSTNAASQ